MVVRGYSKTKTRAAWVEDDIDGHMRVRFTTPSGELLGVVLVRVLCLLAVLLFCFVFCVRFCSYFNVQPCIEVGNNVSVAGALKELKCHLRVPQWRPFELTSEEGAILITWSGRRKLRTALGVHQRRVRQRTE